MKKTTLRQNVKNTDRLWYQIDVTGKTLGHVATKIASLLCGKSRADFTPQTDSGDYVVVLNAEKIGVSGNKEEDKMYYRHSRFIGNLKQRSVGEMRTKNPTQILALAVKGMLPKNRHRKDQLQRLFLIVGDKNPHEAQKPIIITSI